MLMQRFPDFLTELERTVLAYMLQVDSEETRVLREQLASSSLESRDHNGYGFFTNFKVDSGSALCERANFELANVTAVLSGQLCGFILFVRDGKIEFLEGFPLGGDEWPSPEKIETVSGFQSC
jgi:hypothetical protein